jgi:hypothetical protein
MKVKMEQLGHVEAGLASIKLEQGGAGEEKVRSQAATVMGQM